MPAGSNRSYTDLRLGSLGRAGELANLLRHQRANVSGQVGRILEDLQQREQDFELQLGESLAGKQMLVVGPGQHLAEMTFFSRRNTVTGIDLDVIPQGFSPLVYWRMLSTNGGTRTLKTLGRKAVGIDRSFQHELCGQLGLPSIPRHRVLAMDATTMRFADESFDCVYSHSCFEHLEEPAAVIRQVQRVLRPGGVAQVALHLYTSDNGCHDVRIFTGNRRDLPWWSHLRPQHRDKVRSNTYLNGVRLDEWKRLFGDQWPGVQFRYHQDETPGLSGHLAEIRQGGELTDYSDEELLTMDLIAAWKKPEDR